MLFIFIPAPAPPGSCMHRFISRGMLQHYGPLAHCPSPIRHSGVLTGNKVTLKEMIICTLLFLPADLHATRKFRLHSYLFTSTIAFSLWRTFLAPRISFAAAVVVAQLQMKRINKATRLESNVERSPYRISNVTEFTSCSGDAGKLTLLKQLHHKTD